MDIRIDILKNEDTSYTSLEDEVLSFWRKNDIYSKITNKEIFKTSTFRFMDGPPFVSSSSLHFGHLMIGFLKSTVLNYQQMNGYDCFNELGYDCHGLPIEMVANKKLNINGPEDIDKIGIATYNKECKEMISNFSGQWTPIFERIGRFANFDKTYKTMDTNFMESVWWSFSELYRKNLVYRGYKVMPFSTACGSALSNFEAGQNYKDVETKSVYVLFELNKDFSDLIEIKDSIKTYIAVWTTTPWTLPSNLAICLNSEGSYSVIKTEDKIIICGENQISNLGFKDYRILHTLKGQELKGVSYKPLFDDFITDSPDILFDIGDIYTLLCDSYVDVSSSVGTGAVHLAPAFGEDDYRVCLEHNIITPETIGYFCPVDDQGKFTSLIKDFEGMLVSNKSANDEIIKALKIKGALIKTFMYKHSYPFCYRTDTPLIYRAVSSYFIKVSSIKDKLLKNNEKINWTPSHIGSGRFKSWLENAKDWNISRSRYFGTPIPIWVSDDLEEVVVIGSIEELKSATGYEGEIKDLHREFIDKLVIPSKMGKGVLKRINDVFDCWYESGCVPYGQIHYPFENKELIDNDEEFLSDFIAEGLDQTRGWFYTLLILSTALFDKPAFKNVICTGLIMDEKGVKFSKKYGNFKDPMEILNKYGADYLRLYLLSSPTSRAEPLFFKESDIFTVKQRIIPYINAVKFFMTQFIDHSRKGFSIFNLGNINYFIDKDIKDIDIKEIKNINNKDKDINVNIISWITNPLDRWILMKQANLIKFIEHKMKNFEVDSCIDKVIDFIEDLTNWYIKLNRERLRGLDTEDERMISLSVLYFVLMNYVKLSTPFIPFLSEYLYQNLKNLCRFETKESCFLFPYPSYDDYIEKNLIFEEELKSVDLIQEIIKNIRTLRFESRKHNSLKVPINNVIISSNSDEKIDTISLFKDIIMEELNILNLEFKELNNDILYKPIFNNKSMGMKFKGVANKIRSLIEGLSQKELSEFKQTNEIIIKIDDENFIITNKEMSVESVPNLTNFGDSYISKIFDTTMISIDTTYNEEVHRIYSIRSAITAIQKLRKSMGLNPWDKITIEIYDAPKNWSDKLDCFVDKLKCDVKFMKSLELQNSGSSDSLSVLNTIIYEPYSEINESTNSCNKIHFRIINV